MNSGTFNAGERLPSERELSDRFETSRATIREAIIMLELKGLVQVKQGAGIYFTDKKIESKDISEKPLSDVGPFELLQAREVVEPSIAAFVATQIKFNELKELKAVIQTQQKEINGDSEKFEELDRRFHMLIAEFSQNRILINQANALWSVVRAENPLWKELNHQFLHTEELQNMWIDDHTRIFNALKTHSAEEAKKALSQHINNSKRELMRIANTEITDQEDIDDFYFANEIEI